MRTRHRGKIRGHPVGILLLVTVLFSAPARGIGEEQGPVTLNASVDPDTAYIGDPITYRLDLIVPGHFVPETPSPGDQMGPFEVRDYQVMGPQEENDQRQKFQYIWTLVPFVTGELEIPLLKIAVADSSGQMDTVVAWERSITVTSLNPDPQGGIRDIKPPANLPGDRAWIKWLAGSLILLASSFFLYRRYHRTRMHRALGTIAYQGPPRPAHEIALEELERIAALGLLEKGLVKEFYTQVSEAIRRYIGRRYGIPTMELTTGELIRQMKRSDVPPDQIVLFGAFLKECDLVKFAKFMPPVDRQKTLLSQARELVLATRLQPSVPRQQETAEVANPGSPAESPAP